jgi:hypothetical protein
MKPVANLLRWIGIFAAAGVVLLLVFSLIVTWVLASRLERRLAAIQAAGDPLTLAELAPEPIASDENAAVVLAEARSGLAAIDRELTEVYQSEAYRAGSPSPAELEAIENAIEAHAGVLALLERAAACADYGPPLDYSAPAVQFMNNWDHAGDIRAAARFLQARAVLLESQGRRDEALGACGLILRLGRHLDRRPMLVDYLVAVACRQIGAEAANRLLRGGSIDEAARKAFEEELALHDPQSAFERAVKSERVIGLENFRDLPGRNVWPLRIFWDTDACAYVDLIQRHLDLAAKPYADLVAAGLDEKKPPKRSAILTELAKPGLLAARQAADRSTAKLRCLRVLTALQRLERRGGEPKPDPSNLDLPPEATADPFTGEPLKWQKLPEGWVIYAVGKDLKDDGGRVDDDTDVGLAPPAPADAQK